MANYNERDPRSRGERRRPNDPRYQNDPRNVRRNYQPGQYRQSQRRAPAEEEETVDISSTIKGIVAVFITILIVVIIIMLFAKSLFVNSSDLKKNVKTGHLTETAYVSVDPNATLPNQEEVVATETKKKKKKKTTTAEEATPDLPADLNTSTAGNYVVNDAVYLHPEPNSTSAELETLPKGAKVKVYGDANYGWYYLEYDGKLGYAWGTYFTKE